MALPAATALPDVVTAHQDMDLLDMDLLDTVLLDMALLASVMGPGGMGETTTTVAEEMTADAPTRAIVTDEDTMRGETTTDGGVTRGANAAMATGIGIEIGRGATAGMTGAEAHVTTATAPGVDLTTETMTIVVAGGVARGIAPLKGLGATGEESQPRQAGRDSTPRVGAGVGAGAKGGGVRATGAGAGAGAKGGEVRTRGAGAGVPAGVVALPELRARERVTGFLLLRSESDGAVELS